MAKWLARAMSVVGVLALGWASHGFGQPSAAAPAARIRSAAASAPQTAAPPAVLDRQTRGRVVETLGRQPLRFEANAGQFPAHVRFAARGTGYGVALTATGATVALTSKKGRDPPWR